MFLDKYFNYLLVVGGDRPVRRSVEHWLIAIYNLSFL